MLSYLEVAENFAKLKESVLNSSEKAPVFDAKQMSAQIIEELRKIVSPKEEIISAVGHHASEINKSDIKEMIHSKFQQLGMDHFIFWGGWAIFLSSNFFSVLSLCKNVFSPFACELARSLCTIFFPSTFAVQGFFW